MSILGQLYGEAKGIEDSLGNLNKTLSQMKDADKKSNRQEERYRAETLKQQKRARQDEKRNRDTVQEAFDGVMGQKGGQNMAKGGTMAALAAALGVAVAGALAVRNRKKKDEDKEETPTTSSPSSSGEKSEEKEEPPTSGSIKTPKFDTSKAEGKFQVESLKGIGQIKSADNMAVGPRAGDITPKLDIQQLFGDEPGENDKDKALRGVLQDVLKNTQQKQSGGFTGMVPDAGQPDTGDHFFTSVQPGSYIMNRNLVSAMGYQQGGVPVALEKGEIALPPGSYDQGTMDFLNYQAFPRFQSGGLVEASHPATGSGYSIGKDSHGRPSVLSKPAAEALLRAIQDSNGVVKTSDITSAQRSQQHNAKVGGVPNSNHLSGNAIDIHGTSKVWLKEHGAKYGWHNLNYSGHDGHFDFKGNSQVQGGQINSTTKEGSETTASTTSPEGAQKVEGQAQGIMGKLGKLGGIAKEVLEAISAKFAKATGGFDLFNLGAAGAGGLMQQLAGPKGVGGGDATMVSLGSGGGSLKSMTDEQWKELAYIVSGEAERGTDDEYGVAAAVLNRVADPRFPSTIKGVGAQQGQFEAVFSGLARHEPELAKKLKENQSKIAEAMKRLEGRTDFKGTTQYGNMGKGDIKFSKAGNFYHYAEQTGKGTPAPENPPEHWKQWVKSQRGGNVGRYMAGGNVLAQQLHQQNMQYRMASAMDANPVVVVEDVPEVQVVGNSPASNNNPQYLPTRSSSWASALLEYRERSFNIGY